MVLQVCQLSKPHGSSNQLSGALLQISIHAQTCVLVLKHFRDLPVFKGISSPTISLEQVSQQCWHTVTIATPVFPVFLAEIFGFYLWNSFISSIKLDRNNVFISKKMEQALVPPTKPLPYNPFMC